MLLDLRQLRYFVAIVEEGSISKAAAVLNVAQPALSLHVRNMENTLGTSLLFRTPQGVVPTESGEILLRNARIIIGQMTIALQEIKGRESEPSGIVRLGLPGTISQNLSAPLIIAAKQRFPHIKIRIAEAMSGFIAEWIRDARVDLAVLYFPVDDRVLTTFNVLSEPLCLLGPVAPPAGVNAPVKEPLTLKQVSEMPLILPSGSHGLRELLEREAASRNLVLNSIIDIDSYANIKELVERGLGYSILPFNSIAKEAREGRLLSWKIVNPELRRKVHLVHSANRPMTNAVAAIEALCREILVQLSIEGHWSGLQVENLGVSDQSKA